MGRKEFNISMNEMMGDISGRMIATDIEALQTKVYGRFMGKNYTAVGDSITYGFVTTPYCIEVGQQLQLGTVNNLGVSGSALTQVSGRTDSVSERLATIPINSDLVSILIGTNDFGHNSPMGQSGDTSSSTFYGAMDYVCNYLLTNLPTTQHFFITPLHRSGEMVENTQGYILEDYVNAVRDICNIYSIPVLDFYKDGSFDLNVTAQKNIYSGDGLHPLQNGHDIMASKIAAFITKL